MAKKKIDSQLLSPPRDLVVFPLAGKPGVVSAELFLYQASFFTFPARNTPRHNNARVLVWWWRRVVPCQGVAPSFVGRGADGER